VRKVPADPATHVGQNQGSVMTLDEVAGYLRVHRSTLYRLINRGELPGVFRVGSDYRVLRDEFLKWVQSRTSKLK